MWKIRILYQVPAGRNEINEGSKKDQERPFTGSSRTASGARRRKRKKRSYTLYYLLLLFFVLISGITLSVTVFFNIETIEVTGNKLHSSEEIIQQSGIEKGNNLFRINPEKAETSLLAAFGDMDSVNNIPKISKQSDDCRYRCS